MRREAMVLGHPRLTFPLKARLKVQSIGSGAKFAMTTESVRGWEINAEFATDGRPGYNPLSLLEIWIEDEVTGSTIYGFAKYLQPIGKSGMTLRIIEIDDESQTRLQSMLNRTIDEEMQGAV
ncbi:MAG: hypothetical protein EOP10_19540 [Proteobacteria bacterium]|nr:MAG: hypothetical protein EOP10_19540 [Pseudomonadota bacterium]